MIGANVTEMIAEIVALRKLETTGQELNKNHSSSSNNE
jgi:dihydrolipoamide dehydrogenase